MLYSIYISILDILLPDRGKKVRRKGTCEIANLTPHYAKPKNLLLKSRTRRISLVNIIPVADASPFPSGFHALEEVPEWF